MSKWTAELPEDARQCRVCRNWFEPKNYVASECMCTGCAKKS